MLSDTIVGGVEYTIQWLFKTDSVTPKDLTGYSVLVQIRERKSSETTLAEYTEDSAEITFNDVGGSVTLSLTPADTSAFTFKKAVMDCWVYNSRSSNSSSRQSFGNPL